MDRILSVNLRGVILGLKYEIEAMRACGGGAIVNFASFAGVAGVSSKPFYTAAKHGVVGLTKSVGLDQASTAFASTPFVRGSSGRRWRSPTRMHRACSR